MKYKTVLLIVLGVFLLNGCTFVLQRGRRSDVERIRELENELARLRDTRSALEQRLSDEIEGDQVSVQMKEKGLVITFVAEVLFDSGKAILRKDSLPTLAKVANILNEEAARNDIGIEGHTDNVPIKYSKWQSNWELSAHRALSVLHYLLSENVAPKRLSATGYGEYQPVASNDNKGGRQMNRRVEIVILPMTVERMNRNLEDDIPAGYK